MTDIIMTARGKPFTTQTYAEKSLPIGYIAVEQDGGWVGVPDRSSLDRDQQSPHDVICPGCGQSYHEITAQYDSDRNANASMIRLKDKYQEWGWEDLGNDPHSGYGCLVCPDCGTALAPNGRLMVK